MSTLKVGDRVQITGPYAGCAKDHAKGIPYLGQFGSVVNQALRENWMADDFGSHVGVLIDGGPTLPVPYCNLLKLHTTPTPVWTFTSPQVKVVLKCDKPQGAIGGNQFFLFDVTFPWHVEGQVGPVIPVDSRVGLEPAKIQAIKSALTAAYEYTQ